MSYKICVYRGHTATCDIKDIPQLQHIQEPPWRHTSCDPTGCVLKSWKTQSTYSQVYPTNSRPLPQPRGWCAPGRPLPSLSSNPDCNTSLSCDIDLNNTPIAAPSRINESDYLAYNNPAGPNGAMNMYCGPGWKTSRVYGKSKVTALPRPIKHWRKQLLPRQYINIDTGVPIDSTIESLSDFDATNRGRRGNGFAIFERPGGGFITDVSTIIDSGNSNISCVPIYVPLPYITDSCYRLSSLNEEQYANHTACIAALGRIRKPSNTTYNPYVYSTTKGYLQSRVKLHRLQSSITFNVTTTHQPVNLTSMRNEILTPPPTLPPSTISLYLISTTRVMDQYGTNPKQLSCYTTDCSCAVAVSYKPRNRSFARDTSVTARTNIRRKKKIAITKNQYNVTNKWGQQDPQTSYKLWPQEEYRTRGKRHYSGVSGSGALNNLCRKQDCPPDPQIIL